MYVFNQIFQNISTLLLLPVLFALAGLFLQALFKLGQFITSYKIRKRKIAIWSEEETAIDTFESLKQISFLIDKDDELANSLTKLLESKKESAAEDRVLQWREERWDKELQTSKNFIRLGPMLGLMGTLIPMGPALMGLANGDVASMAGHMQVAFSTTVLGVFLGVIGYLLYTNEKQWVQWEILVLEELADRKVEPVK